MTRDALVTIIKVVLFWFLMGPKATVSKPIRVTIECSSREDDSSFARDAVDLRNTNFKINSFCDLIHDIIPKAVKEGKFVVDEELEDQYGHSNDMVPYVVPPPNGFVPNLKFPRIKKVQVPRMKIPQLRKLHGGNLKLHNGPNVIKLNHRPLFRNLNQENSSAERMEKFKKGVHKMLHVVKVLGQIDQYLSERTRIVVDKLAKTFHE